MEAIFALDIGGLFSYRLESWNGKCDYNMRIVVWVEGQAGGVAVDRRLWSHTAR